MSLIQIHCHMDHSSFNESFLTIIPCLVYGARYSAKLLTKVTSLDPQNNILGKHFCPHIIDEDTEVLKDQVSYLNSHSKW